MAPLTDVFEKALLDWVTGAAAVTQPQTRWISLATAAPTSESSFDGPFSNAQGGRATVTFAGANSPAGSVTNLNAFSNITATAAPASVGGWNLWNSSAGGTRIAYGTATATIGVKSGDNVGIAAGAIKITLT